MAGWAAMIEGVIRPYNGPFHFHPIPTAMVPLAFVDTTQSAVF